MTQQHPLGPLMIDVAGTALDAQDQEILQHPLVGGVILFTRNYEDPQQLRELIRTMRSCRQPLLIAVDHEGGRVQRFREGFSRLPAVAELGRLYAQNTQEAEQQTRQFAYQMAHELIAVGVDFSFAPVLDLDRGTNSMIGDRSFGADVEEVVTLGQQYIKGMHAAGMAAVGKHFPGHGGVSGDSHYELPVDERAFSEIAASDLLPFQRLKNVLDAVMPAHVLYPAVDALPASLSRFWLQEVLRGQLGFEGAILSDDLSMAGAEIVAGPVERASLALEASCDMILVCNARGTVVQLLDGLKHQPNAAAQTRLMNMIAQNKAR